jgi:hypothetical protein
MNIGMGGHQSSKMMKDEWLTPPEIIKELGPFDLDPCAPIVRPWETAKRHFTVEDNGLLKVWNGRVFCNPPYGKETGKWLSRCAEHMDAIALIFARTETKDWEKHVWGKATAILFIYGRLYFHHVDGSRASANSGAPSALIAYNNATCQVLKRARIPGRMVVL